MRCRIEGCPRMAYEKKCGHKIYCRLCDEKRKLLAPKCAGCRPLKGDSKLESEMALALAFGNRDNCPIDLEALDAVVNIGERSNIFTKRTLALFSLAINSSLQES